MPMFTFTATLQLPETASAAGTTAGRRCILPALCPHHHICEDGLLHHQGNIYTYDILVRDVTGSSFTVMYICGRSVLFIQSG